MPVTADEVRAARERIAPHVRRTPTMRLSLPTPAGAIAVVAKLEFTQIGGSFKLRGSLNAVRHAQDDGRLTDAGVIVASGGNAAIGAAHAARIVGTPCTVVVPTTAPQVKVDALHALGATVHLVGDRYQQAADAAHAMAVSTGALPLHAYDLPDIVAGAGTIASEIAEDIDGPVTTVVCVGGGGLLAGLIAAARDSDTAVGAEPVGSSCLDQALAAGRPVDVENTSVAADSLGATRVGSLCWAAVDSATTSVATVTVTDDDIIAARRHLWSDARIVVEHGTATSVAAVMTGAVVPQPDTTLCVVLCGANTAVTL